MIWYLVLGDSCERDMDEVAIRATDADSACVAAKIEYCFERIWSVVPALRRAE